jgi:energy-coupling factor transporter transmembrane protein EcfT
MASAAELASTLFIDAYRRSGKLQVALDSRAYDGELRVLPSTYQRNDLLLLSGFCAIASLFVMWRAL